jgi:hypothetical protein
MKTLSVSFLFPSKFAMKTVRRTQVVEAIGNAITASDKNQSLKDIMPLPLAN